jgi:hypothetical protein
VHQPDGLHLVQPDAVQGIPLETLTIPGSSWISAQATVSVACRQSARTFPVGSVLLSPILKLYGKSSLANAPSRILVCERQSGCASERVMHIEARGAATERGAIARLDVDVRCVVEPVR